jgi:hypothetical protein
MNGRTIARILLAIVLIGGAITLGIGAYNAGVTAGLAQTGQVVVANGGYLAPGGAYIGYGWGFGWGHGFGFFGFLGGLLFLFLLVGLFRAAFGGPRRGWDPGYGPGRRHGWGSGWEDRAREAHDAWHREHPEAANGPDRPTA